MNFHNTSNCFSLNIFRSYNTTIFRSWHSPTNTNDIIQLLCTRPCPSLSASTSQQQQQRGPLRCLPQQESRVTHHWSVGARFDRTFTSNRHCHRGYTFIYPIEIVLSASSRIIYRVIVIVAISGSRRTKVGWWWCLLLLLLLLEFQQVLLQENAMWMPNNYMCTIFSIRFCLFFLFQCLSRCFGHVGYN